MLKARSKDIMAGIQGWLSHFIGFVGPKSTPFFLRARFPPSWKRVIGIWHKRNCQSQLTAITLKSKLHRISSFPISELFLFLVVVWPADWFCYFFSDPSSNSILTIFYSQRWSYVSGCWGDAQDWREIPGPSERSYVWANQIWSNDQFNSKSSSQPCDA